MYTCWHVIFVICTLATLVGCWIVLLHVEILTLHNTVDILRDRIHLFESWYPDCMQCWGRCEGVSADLLYSLQSYLGVP